MCVCVCVCGGGGICECVCVWGVTIGVTIGASPKVKVQFFSLNIYFE